MRNLRRIVFCLLAAVASLCTSVEDARADEDPYAIYAHAREFWAAQRYPAHVIYDVVVRVTQNGKPLEERYEGRFNALTGTVDVDPTSDYEREHPPTGSGVRVSLFGAGMTAPSSAAVDFIGVPVLAPNYAFGMWKFVPQRDEPASNLDLVRQIRNEFHDPAPRPLPSSQPASAIATVVAYERVYDITRAPDEVVGATACIHLLLRPRSDPHTHRLRELDLDPRTYATVRARISSNFIDGPGTGIPWTIDFGEHDGAQYIVRETAMHPWAQYRRTYDTVEISFEHLRLGSAPAYPHMFSAPDILREP